MSKLRVLDLFSGVGGFSLGLERTGGFGAAAFCEIEPHARKVIGRHWSSIPVFDDVRELTLERLLAAGVGHPNVITGGFPCQDLSRAGNGAGLEGERSGLWRELLRLVREVRPDYIIMENSPALLDRGLGVILGELAESGYDAEWDCFPASAMGAPHDRDRLYLVAYPCSFGFHLSSQTVFGHLPNPPRHSQAPQPGWDLQQLGPNSPIRHALAGDGSGMGDGLSAELDPEWRARVHALGNAVVPQIPEMIGRAILAAHSDRVSEQTPLSRGEAQASTEGTPTP